MEHEILSESYVAAVSLTLEPWIRPITVSRKAFAVYQIMVYKNDLPYWHRLYLGSKKEKHLEAAEPLIRLSNTRKAKHMLKTVDEIKQLSRINELRD